MRISINGFSLQGIKFQRIQDKGYIIKGRLYYKDFSNKASSYMAIANFVAKISLSADIKNLFLLSNNIDKDNFMHTELKINILDLNISGREKLLNLYNKEIQNIINRANLNVHDKYFEFIITHLIQVENIILNIYNINKELKENLNLLFKEKLIDDEILDQWINIDPYFIIAIDNFNFLYYYGYFLNLLNNNISFSSLQKFKPDILNNNSFKIFTLNTLEDLRVRNNFKELSISYLGSIKETFAHNFKLF